MPRRLVNLSLLLAVPLLAATGLIAWVAPPQVADALMLVHRGAGVALLLALTWKYGIARRSLSRRLRGGSRRGIAVAAMASTALLLVLGLGLAWTIGLVSFDRPIAYSALNLHVFIGVALVPLALAHAAQRWESRPAIATALDRRAAVRALALGAVAIAVTAALDSIGLARRPTGSRAANAFSGNDFPLTIWAFDSVPDVDIASWRMRIDGQVAAPGSISYDELLKMPSVERDALLDCTGGWWTEQRWRGVTVSELLASRGLSPSARRVEVTSLTGHAWSFSLTEIEDLVICTHVGGETLSAGHGYPARLIAPSHRGFQWIKWVGRLHVA